MNRTTPETAPSSHTERDLAQLDSRRLGRLAFAPMLRHQEGIATERDKLLLAELGAELTRREMRV